jgi:hypothetical protein
MCFGLCQSSSGLDLKGGIFNLQWNLVYITMLIKYIKVLKCDINKQKNITWISQLELQILYSLDGL